MKRLLLPLALLCTLCFLQGCAIYGIYDDQRLTDTISSDKAVSTIIKKDLLNEGFSEGWNISTYCYYGHVFLVGTCPENMRNKAVSVARRDNRVRSVTCHWFEPAMSTESDTLVATRLRSNLITGKYLSSTRVDTEVNSNRAVLLGVVADEQERQLAMKYAANTKGINTVTSYLILAPRGGSPDRVPAPQTIPGTYPSTQAGQEGIPGEPTSVAPDTTLPASSGADLGSQDLQ